MAERETNPSRDALCMMITGGDLATGYVLFKVSYWAKYGRAEIPGVDGTWIAHKRAWWAREMQISVRQVERALTKLQRSGLLEKCQWWWGRQNIMHVRPTQSVLDFLQIGKTWDSAEEFLPLLFPEKTPPGITKTDKPGMPNLVISNGFAEVGEPGLPTEAISKDIINKPNALSVILHTGTSPATPSSASSESESPDKSKKNTLSSLPILVIRKNGKPSISSLALLWCAAMNAEYPDHPPAFLTSSELGQLAELIGLYPADICMADAMVFMIQNWQLMDDYGKTKYPQVNYLCETTLTVLHCWETAGQPSVIEKVQHA